MQRRYKKFVRKLVNNFTTSLPLTLFIFDIKRKLFEKKILTLPQAAKKSSLNPV